MPSRQVLELAFPPSPEGMGGGKVTWGERRTVLTPNKYSYLLLTSANKSRSNGQYYPPPFICLN